MATYDGTIRTDDELALAKVGLDALIDEATGFQEVRPDGELADRYQRYSEGAEDRNSIAFWLPGVEASGVPTPRTRLVKTDVELVRILDGETPQGWDGFIADLGRAALTLGVGSPFFLRTGHTSGKHRWQDTCCVDSLADLPAHVCAIVEGSQGIPSLPTDVWAVREMLDVEPLFHCTAFGNMPVVREFRLFVKNGEVDHIQPYWPPDAIAEGRPDTGDWLRVLLSESVIMPTEQRALEAMAYLVRARLPGYWSMDFLQDRDGKWWLTDIAEGDRSFRWEPSEVHHLSSGQVLVGVHRAQMCSGHCPLHNPSDHHMRDWPLVWRGDQPFDIWSGFERTCEHGVGHLDPDTAAWYRSNGEEPPMHGCCIERCCSAEGR